MLLSCNNDKFQASIDELYEVEKQFSDMAVNKGMAAAFLYFCDENGVLLRPESYPIVGKNEVAKRLPLHQDSLFTLSWEPLDGYIAKSGELGYTYGTYKISYKDKSLPDENGTYVTIWKKNEGGSWKFLLDTGQEGLE